MHRPPGTTLVAIHVRRGDYSRLAAEEPWFRPLPEAWYLRWLAQIWPTLENPVLFVATDDRAAVLPAFAAYHPLDASEAEAEMPEPRLLADFEILAQSDVLAVCNSSFSHMAALSWRRRHSAASSRRLETESLRALRTVGYGRFLAAVWGSDDAPALASAAFFAQEVGMRRTGLVRRNASSVDSSAPSPSHTNGSRAAKNSQK